MNKVILMGRLTKDPEVRYTNGNDSKCVATYTLAVDRMGKDAGADFIRCQAWQKNGEFAEKYLKKGTKICIEGNIRTGSYEKDGKKVYTTDVVVNRHEFCEGKSAAQETVESTPVASTDDFMEIPEGVQDTLPFA